MWPSLGGGERRCYFVSSLTSHILSVSQFHIKIKNIMRNNFVLLADFVLNGQLNITVTMKNVFINIFYSYLIR